MPFDWRQMLALSLIGAGGGNPAQALMMQQQKKDQAALAKAFAPQEFPSPTSPTNPAPTIGTTPPNPNAVLSTLAKINPQLAVQYMTSSQDNQRQQSRWDQQMAENRRQFDIEQVTAAERDVAGSTERSLDRGYRMNQDVNQRNFMRERDESARQTQLDVADIRAKSMLGSADNVASTIPLEDGRLLRTYRNGRQEIVTGENGQPLRGINAPEAVFNRGAAQSGGRAAGTVAEAAPTVDANFRTITETLLGFDDPKVKSQAPYAIGVGSYAPTVPGLNSDFRARQEQLKGQAFLQAYNSLRGTGAISEAEGAKAEQSIARLQSAQTTDEFYNALSEARKTFADIHGAMQERAKRGAVVPQMRSGAQPSAQQQSQGDPLAEARAAIARGAPRDKVIERLRANGINATGL